MSLRGAQDVSGSDVRDIDVRVDILSQNIRQVPDCIARSKPSPARILSGTSSTHASTSSKSTNYSLDSSCDLVDRMVTINADQQVTFAVPSGEWGGLFVISGQTREHSLLIVVLALNKSTDDFWGSRIEIDMVDPTCLRIHSTPDDSLDYRRIWNFD